MAFVEKHKCSGLARVYTKSQLLQLCAAYGILAVSRLNKANLGKRLATAISAHGGFVRPGAIDSRVYTVARIEQEETSDHTSRDDSLIRSSLLFFLQALAVKGLGFRHLFLTMRVYFSIL